MQSIAIIGGGASGVICALKASQNSNNYIYIFEKNPRILKKVLSTGNGKCNLSNTYISSDKYNSIYKNKLNDIFLRYSSSDTLEYFKTLGLYTYTEKSGRIYPRSNQASSVVDVLRFALEKDNICVLTEHNVNRVEKKDDVFKITCDKGIYQCDKVVVACGGPAAPVLGAGKTGINILSSFGHTIIPLRPSLVQIKTDNTYTRSLKGIKTIAHIKIFENNVLLSDITDELLFTEYGLSGPAALNASKGNHFDNKKIKSTAQLDFAHDHSEHELFNILLELKKHFNTCENLLTGFINKRLGQIIIKYAGFSLSKSTESLTEADIQKITYSIKNFTLDIHGTNGFENAQVSAGGAKLDEFDDNLQSKYVHSLFCTGEVLDVDGICGGYNLQWAWSSGLLVGDFLKNA